MNQLDEDAALSMQAFAWHKDQEAVSQYIVAIVHGSLGSDIEQ